MKWQSMTLFPQPYDAQAATRTTQWCFIVVAGIAVIIVAIAEPKALQTVGAVISATLVVAATAIVHFPPVALTPSTWPFYLVPVLDALAIASLRAEMPAATTGALLSLVIPSVWLGTSGIVRGVALAGLVSLVCVVPDIIAMALGLLAVDAGVVSLVALTPIAMTATALFAFGLVDEADAATTAESTTRRLRDAIIETVDVGIVVLDADGEIVLVNRGIREHPIMRGAGVVDSAALKRVAMFMADGVTPYPAGEDPIRTAMHSEGGTDEVFWAHQADGTPHAFVAQSTRLLDDGSKVFAIVVALNDVTRFLDAVQSRDRLISTVSHELRTPLTAMKGFLELARDEVVDPSSSLSRHLAIIERNLHREHAIVEQFILAADSFNDRLKLRIENVDLAAIVREVVAASLIAPTRPGVSISVHGESVPCRVDPALAAAAVDALLSNAVFALSGGGEVSISISSPSHDWARIEVTDHGVGIADIDRGRLFEPFFRTARTHADAAPGVGLGLTLVKQIIDAHNGLIGIESELGVGTTVSILLPTHADSREEDRRKTGAETEGFEPSDPLTGSPP